MSPNTAEILRPSPEQLLASYVRQLSEDEKLTYEQRIKKTVAYINKHKHDLAVFLVEQAAESLDRRTRRYERRAVVVPAKTDPVVLDEIRERIRSGNARRGKQHIEAASQMLRNIFNERLTGFANVKLGDANKDLLLKAAHQNESMSKTHGSMAQFYLALTKRMKTDADVVSSVWSVDEVSVLAHDIRGV